MKDVVIKKNVLKQLLVLFGCLLMLAAGILVVMSDPKENTGRQRIPDELVIPLRIVCLVFFGGGFILIVYQWLKHKNILVINSKGFYDYSTVINQDFTSWGNVTEIKMINIEISKKKTMKMIGVEINNIDEILSNMPKYKQILTRLNKDKYSSITININSAKESPEYLLQIMQEFHSSYLSNLSNSNKSSNLSNSGILRNYKTLESDLSRYQPPTSSSPKS